MNGDSENFKRWLKFNIRPQRQPDYVTVNVALPLGDITANQLRALADIIRRFTKETIRTTVEQNFAIRWVSKADLPELYKALNAAGLANVGAGALVDITSCPGTDTCKLGISSSRGLAAELRRQVEEKNFQSDEAVQKLHIKISGCFNSCGQHHVADLGFYGVSRKIAGHAVPHFQVVLGGQWEQNAGSYGLPVVAVPSKNIPKVVSRLTERYLADRQTGEVFKDFVKRTGKAELKNMLDDLTRPPAGDRSFFSDWGDVREYTLGDMGDGECAGEVVSLVEFGLAAAERELFEAQLAFEKGDAAQAGTAAYRSMLTAAKALVQVENPECRQRSRSNRRRIPPSLLRHQTVFRSICGRQIRRLSVLRTRKIRAALHRRIQPLLDRRSATFHRRRPQLQQPSGKAGGSVKHLCIEPRTRKGTT